VIVLASLKPPYDIRPVKAQALSLPKTQVRQHIIITVARAGAAASLVIYPTDIYLHALGQLLNSKQVFGTHVSCAHDFGVGDSKASTVHGTGSFSCCVMPPA
jgi:hypothetical protein